LAGIRRLPGSPQIARERARIDGLAIERNKLGTHPEAYANRKLF